MGRESDLAGPVWVGCGSGWGDWTSCACGGGACCGWASDGAGCGAASAGLATIDSGCGVGSGGWYGCAWPPTKLRAGLEADVRMPWRRPRS